MQINTEFEKKLPGDVSLPSSSDELATLIELGNSGNFDYSVEDFFRLPEKSRYQLSPDGNYFSFMGPYERRQNIFIQKIGTEEAIRITNETDRGIFSYFWANDNRLLYIKDDGGNENFKLFGVDKDGSNPKDLTPFESVRINIIDQLKDIPEEVIIGMNKNNPQLFEPYRLNIETGNIERLAENSNPMEPVTLWKTDHEGKLRIASKMKDGTKNTLLYRDREEEEFQEVITTDFREDIQPLFFDFHNKSIAYVTTNIGRDKNVIVKFDMKKGEEIGTPLFQHPDVDVQSMGFSHKRKVLTYISYVTSKKHYHFLDPQREKIFKKLIDEIGDYEFVITAISKEEDKFMVRSYSDRSLGAYYLYDQNTDQISKLAEVSPWINEDEMAIQKPIQYTSRDGITINGYLTLPRGVEAKNLPIIINPHGGPWARDNWGFNAEIQLMANRGYGVLQMNFRGSIGFGRDFWEKSFNQWGRAMQDDISDGVQWLIDQKIANPKRIAIYGGSYGGYATLAGVTFTPDLYACAIDYVGVSNLFTFMNTFPPYWKPYQEMMYTMVGHPERDKVAMAATSPALHVENIKAPLFVIQGANDPRVNIDEADQIVRSLRQRNIDVPYMVKYDEGHGFHNEENRFEVFKAMIGFLKKHL